MAKDKKPPHVEKPPTGKEAAKALKEKRIEQIASLMRLMVNPDGTPTWTRRVRIALATSWGIPDSQIKFLSAEASKRVCAEVVDREEVQRNIGVALGTGIHKTLAGAKWSDLAKLSAVALKMIESPQKTEVTVTAKMPTPAEAAQAVKAMFGTKVSNESDDTPSKPAEPTDGAEEDPPKE